MSALLVTRPRTLLGDSRSAAAGARVPAPDAMVSILEHLCVHGFTRRQLQVLGASALGYSAAEMADGQSKSA